jgi:hypothetical protein
MSTQTGRATVTPAVNCPECDSEQLTWFVSKRNAGAAQDGRLRMHEVAVEFVQGCDECGATVRRRARPEGPPAGGSAVMSVQPVRVPANWHGGTVHKDRVNRHPWPGEPARWHGPTHAARDDMPGDDDGLTWCGVRLVGQNLAQQSGRSTADLTCLACRTAVARREPRPPKVQR